MHAPAEPSATPKLYKELADWWPLLSAPEGYAEEAATYRDNLIACARRSVRRALELGSGGGNNASHSKAHFEMTLVDLSPHMLDASRTLNPECEHIEGDMRTMRLESSTPCSSATPAAQELQLGPVRRRGGASHAGSAPVCLRGRVVHRPVRPGLGDPDGVAQVPEPRPRNVR